MKFILIIFIAFTFSNCHLAQFYKIQKAMQTETMKQYAFKREIPFKNMNGFIVIEATIGNKTGDFILDTGASTMLDEAFVKNIPFEILGKRKHKDVNGKKKQLKTIQLKTLSVSDITFKGIVATVSDLEVLKLLKTNLCINVSGILGVNIMNKGVWQIDYFKNKITITDNKDSLNLPIDKKIIGFYSTGRGTPQIRVTSNGIYIGEAELDTGNTGDFTMPKQAVSMFPLLETFIVKRGLSAGAFGTKEDSSFKTQLPTLTLGQSFDAQNTMISFSNTHSGMPLIGYEFLKDYVVTIDWKYNEIILSSFKPSLEKSFFTFGFSTIFKEGKLCIASITEQSSADKAGFKLNDQILQINGEDYRQITQTDYCDFLQQDLLKRSDTLMLVVKRGEIEIKQKVTKTDLIKILMKK